MTHLSTQELSSNLQRKFLELIRKLSMVTGYKVSAKKSIIFIFATNDWKLNLKITIYHSSKKLKYLSINLKKSSGAVC